MQTFDPDKSDSKEVFGKFCLEYGKLFVGFVEQLKKLRNTRMAVVSSGSEVYVKKFCQDSGIHFDYILAYEAHHSKEIKIQNISNYWGIDPSQVICIVDTETDVIEIRRILPIARIIGVDWGFQGKQVLLKHLPEEQILVEFEDIHSVLAELS